MRSADPTRCHRSRETQRFVKLYNWHMCHELFLPARPGGPVTFDENSNIFVTQEGLEISRDLYFNYTVSVVPLPASGWLLLAGLGGLAAVGRRRR